MAYKISINPAFSPLEMDNFRLMVFSDFEITHQEWKHGKHAQLVINVV